MEFIINLQIKVVLKISFPIKIYKNDELALENVDLRRSAEIRLLKCDKYYT